MGFGAIRAIAAMEAAAAAIPDQAAKCSSRNDTISLANVDAAAIAVRGSSIAGDADDLGSTNTEAICGCRTNSTARAPTLLKS